MIFQGFLAGVVWKLKKKKAYKIDGKALSVQWTVHLSKVSEIKWHFVFVFSQISFTWYVTCIGIT